MKIDKNEIEKIADLARLDLTEEEKIKYAKNLSDVLDYMKILDEVDISGVEDTSQTTGLKNIYREDVVISSEDLVVEKLIEAFPEKIRGQLKVKQVFN